MEPRHDPDDGRKGVLLKTRRHITTNRPDIRKDHGDVKAKKQEKRIRAPGTAVTCLGTSRTRFEDEDSLFPTDGGPCVSGGMGQILSVGHHGVCEIEIEMEINKLREVMLQWAKRRKPIRVTEYSRMHVGATVKVTASDDLYGVVVVVRWPWPEGNSASDVIMDRGRWKFIGGWGIFSQRPWHPANEYGWYRWYGYDRMGIGGGQSSRWPLASG